MHQLLETYIRENLRPTYVASKLILNLYTFQKLLSVTALHKQLEYILFGKFVKDHDIGKKLRWAEFDEWDK